MLDFGSGPTHTPISLHIQLSKWAPHQYFSIKYTSDGRIAKNRHNAGHMVVRVVDLLHGPSDSSHACVRWRDVNVSADINLLASLLDPIGTVIPSF